MKSINMILYWVIAMVIGLSACGDDDEKTIPAHTEEEKIWIADNQKYFQQKYIPLHLQNELKINLKVHQQ